MPNSSVKGLILMGGQSSRMGEDKAFVKWKGKTLLQHAIENLGEITSDVYLSVNHNQHKTLSEHHQCILDKWPDQGPIGGILSSLEVLKTDLLVLAVDMPMVTNSMLHTLISKGDLNKVKAYQDKETKDWFPLPSIWPISLFHTIATFGASPGSMNTKSPSLKKILETYGVGLTANFNQDCILNVNRLTDLR